VQFKIAVPNPGTELHEIVKREGQLLTTDWSKYVTFGHPVFELDELTPELMKRMQRQAYKELYTRPSYMLQRLLRVRSLAELKGLISGGIGVIKVISGIGSVD